MDATYRPSCSVESSVRTVCNVWHGVCIYWGLARKRKHDQQSDGHVCGVALYEGIHEGRVHHCTAHVHTVMDELDTSGTSEREPQRGTMHLRLHLHLPKSARAAESTGPKRDSAEPKHPRRCAFEMRADDSLQAQAGAEAEAMYTPLQRLWSSISAEVGRSDQHQQQRLALMSRQISINAAHGL